MPTKKGVSEYELSAIDCCALYMAMFENKDVKMMLRSLPQHRVQEIFKAYHNALASILRDSKNDNAFMLNIFGEEGLVCKAYLEREIDRLIDLAQENRNMKLGCNHAAVVHLGALTEIWELFPKEKVQ